MKKFKGFKPEVVKPSAQLPAGNYVVLIKAAKEVIGSDDSGDRIDFQIDIAEGDNKDFFTTQYKENTSEDKKYKGKASIWYPKDDGSSEDQKTIRSFNAFCAHLQEENKGFIVDLDKEVSQFKGKKIGAAFREEWNKDENGREYKYTSFAWFCSADEVREGKATVANVKFRNGATGKVYNSSSLPSGNNAGFVNIPDGVEEEEIPFN